MVGGNRKQDETGRSGVLSSLQLPHLIPTKPLQRSLSRYHLRLRGHAHCPEVGYKCAFQKDLRTIPLSLLHIAGMKWCKNGA